SGFRVDIGVLDPKQPGRFVLGVECDGATYHNGRSARDRDRLRQEVLESLGWRLHRVWSTDWFRNPRRETDRLLAEIRTACETPKHNGTVEPRHEAKTTTTAILDSRRGDKTSEAVSPDRELPTAAV